MPPPSLSWRTFGAPASPPLIVRSSNSTVPNAVMPDPIAITRSTPLPSILVFPGPLPRTVAALKMENSPDSKDAPPGGSSNS